MTDGIEPVAWADAAPAVVIAALRPDLILVPDQESAELLADIAPTVPAGAADGIEWKDDLRERLDAITADCTVASPQVAFDHTQIYVDRPDSFSSAVVTELGFTLAPLVTDAAGDEPIAISFERLPEIDADIVFWQVRQRDEDGARATAGCRWRRTAHAGPDPCRRRRHRVRSRQPAWVLPDPPRRPPNPH